ncbi:MAG TPA: hypothetical protein VLV50_01900 [Stellaceae bacterium]|nr:hypothetical protein [Stellaceae bacterium]
MPQSAGQSIRGYRCYLFDAAGHIAIVHEIEATSDKEACEFADRMLAEQPRYPAIEVWDRARQVCRLGTEYPSERTE